ncbi:MAG TPA: sortase [Rhodanobacteraceae bacterium]|nr:sortase [Rhodanobacteraceae bacterium]
MANFRVRDVLARALIARAWKRTLVAGAAVQPWPGAGLFPVARLEAPARGAALIVLAGARARALRFGPSHVEGTPLPGDPGNAVISGRRDMHFAFVRELRSGDALLVHSASGRLVSYLVAGIEVVRRNDVRVLLDAGDERLTLVTRYPFDATAGGPLRYVVVAVRSEAAVARG